MLDVQQLSCSFGNREILKKLNFHVNQGSYTVIVGPNGSGKSTLLRCLDGLLDHWTGTVLLNSTSLRFIKRRKLAQTIAYVPQVVPGFVFFTVRQFIEMSRYPHLWFLTSLSEYDEQIIQRSATLMEINSEMMLRPLEELSGGERQKVFLAAALAQEPQLLLLDEPTTFLDYRHQVEISQLLKKISYEQKITILEVTHDLNHAVLSGDHLLAIVNGELVFDGSPTLFMQSEKLQTVCGSNIQRVSHPKNGLPMILPWTDR